MKDEYIFSFSDKIILYMIGGLQISVVVLAILFYIASLRITPEKFSNN
jgi:hypothetical protein